MKIKLIVPAAGEVELDRALDFVTNQVGGVEPFGKEALDICRTLSERLFKSPEARAYNDLQALAYWLRPAEIERLALQYRNPADVHTLSMPRGLVFHLPSANVYTLFVYSWIFALLTGNRSIIRLSQRTMEQTDILCNMLNEIFTTHSSGTPPGHTVIISYGHEEEVTAYISSLADVRVIWGGDETIRKIREIPLQPQAMEVTFPDRSSWCILKARAYQGLDNSGKIQLAGQFFNDSYWFDQLACASPRLVLWCGRRDECDCASTKFFELLRSVIEAKRYRVELGTAMRKKLFSYRAALDKPVHRCHELCNELTVIKLKEPCDLGGEFSGSGLFFQLHVNRIEDLAVFVSRRDQTLTHFGLSEEELRQLALLCNGRGIDRMVPIGSALNFGRFWDGYDLLKVFSRQVYINTI